MMTNKLTLDKYLQQILSINDLSQIKQEIQKISKELMLENPEFIITNNEFALNEFDFKHIQKELNQILETHNQIKQLIGQLLDFDLPNILRSLNNNIEKQQKQSEIHFQEMKKMQTWSLIGFGVLVVVMIVFKFL